MTLIRTVVRQLTRCIGCPCTSGSTRLYFYCTQEEKKDN